MKFTIEIRMNNAEGILERILGRLRQRNVSIDSLNANCSFDQSTIDASITLTSHKPAEAVMKQLDKLYDIQQMRIFYPEQYSAPQHYTGKQHYVGEQNEVCLSV